MIIKIAICAMGIFLTSLLTGLLTQNDDVKLVPSLVNGFLIQMAVVEILGLVCIFTYRSFRFFFAVYVVVTLALCAVGIFRKGRLLLRRIKDKKSYGISVFLILAFLVAGAQIGVLEIGSHTDEDDAFFVATATTTLDTNTLYRYSPYTGEAYKKFPARYVLSPFPLYVSAVSRMYGLRPLVVSHSVLPVVVIVLGYGAIWCLGLACFDDIKKVHLLVFFCTVFSMFAYFSTWSYASRVFLRPWQGKTILTAIVLPVVFAYLTEHFSDEKPEKKSILWLTVLLLAGCFVSSMGVILPMLMVLIFAVVDLLLKRHLFVPIAWGCACIPSILLCVTYVLIR